MGEGGGVVVVEELEHAKARGAKIWCELSGYGLSGDAYHMTAPPPDGEGAARAMKMALDHAGLNPTDVDYVNAHATSTGLGDICETHAIKTVFGDHAKNGLAISSTKSMTGHLLGGAGAVELAICALAVRDGKIPPTINLENPDPECDLDYTPLVAREKNSAGSREQLLRLRRTQRDPRHKRIQRLISRDAVFTALRATRDRCHARESFPPLIRLG